MDSRTRQVLERVAEGVWQVNATSWCQFHQCAFCYSAPESGHDADCPVVLAQQALEADAKSVDKIPATFFGER